jgi:cytochrome c oxidase cbb3-type subunit 4
MEYKELVELQGYVKIIFTFIVFVIFYSWVYSIYKRDKTGEKDYESYSNLVHDDSISSIPLEQIDKDEKKEKIV